MRISHAGVFVDDQDNDQKKALRFYSDPPTSSREASGLGGKQSEGAVVDRFVEPLRG